MRVSMPIWLQIEACKQDFDASLKGGRQTQIIEWVPSKGKNRLPGKYEQCNRIPSCPECEDFEDCPKEEI